jgi:hypothetical protein
MDQLSEADKKLCTDSYNSFERKTISLSFYKCLKAVLLEDGTPEEQKLARGLKNKIPADKLIKARKYVRIKHLILYNGEVHSNMPAMEEVADEDSHGSMEQQQKQGQRTVLKTVVHGDSVLKELVTQAERLAVQGRLTKSNLLDKSDGYMGMPRMWVEQVYTVVSNAAQASVDGEFLSCVLVLLIEASCSTGC